MVSEAKRKANAKSDKKNSKVITIKFSKNKDKEILDYLDNLDNKAGYIKELIEDDLKSKGIIKELNPQKNTRNT